MLRLIKAKTNKPKMKHRFALILMLMSLMLMLGACAKRPALPGTWTVGNNQPNRLSDFKGKVVVLDFYATWCEPCRAETPRLVQMQKDYGASGLQVIGLNVGGDEDRAKVPAFAKEFGIEYTLGFPDDNLVDQYLTDNQNIPQAFVFDHDGNLIKRFIGHSPKSGAELEQVVRSAVNTFPPERRR